MFRRQVNKRKSAKQFRARAGKTMRKNVTGVLRGGIRL